MRIRHALPAIAAIVVVGCASESGPPVWLDAADSGWLSVVDSETVLDGDGWRFDVGTERGDTGTTTARCLQLVVADQPLGCIRFNDFAENGFAAATRIGGERVIWRAGTSGSFGFGEPVDHFVVWSSASPDGRRIEPIVYEDVENLVWIMEPGEAPWGYQAIAVDGTLIVDRSHVGLPEN